MQNLLRSERAHDVRVRAHPHAGVSHLAQHGVEHTPVAAVRNRVDPHENTVELQKALANGVGDVIA